MAPRLLLVTDDRRIVSIPTRSVLHTFGTLVKFSSDAWSTQLLESDHSVFNAEVLKAISPTHPSRTLLLCSDGTVLFATSLDVENTASTSFLFLYSSYLQAELFRRFRARFIVADHELARPELFEARPSPFRLAGAVEESVVDLQAEERAFLLHILPLTRSCAPRFTDSPFENYQTKIRTYKQSISRGKCQPPMSQKKKKTRSRITHTNSFCLAALPDELLDQILQEVYITALKAGDTATLLAILSTSFSLRGLALRAFEAARRVAARDVVTFVDRGVGENVGEKAYKDLAIPPPWLLEETNAVTLVARKRGSLLPRSVAAQRAAPLDQVITSRHRMLLDAGLVRDTSLQELSVLEV